MIRLHHTVGSGFPSVEGERLADSFLKSPPAEPGFLEVDLRKVEPKTLITAFFFAFFERVLEENRSRFNEATRICWLTDYEFQADLVKMARDSLCSAIFYSTRSNASPEAHRDMVDFDPDEELARLRLALANDGARAQAFVLEAVKNLDEHLSRGGALPAAWQRAVLPCVRSIINTSAAETGRVGYAQAARALVHIQDMPRGAQVLYDLPAAAEHSRAYTIGRTSSYDKSLAEEPEVKKIGKSGDYKGGWVFRTPEEAHNFLGSYAWKASMKSGEDPADYSVYELELSGPWEECASAQPKEDGVHRLLKDARVIGKMTP